MKYVYPCFCVGNAEGKLHNIEKGRCHAMHEMALGQIISFTQCAVSSTRGSLLINGVYLCVHFHFHLNKFENLLPQGPGFWKSYFCPRRLTLCP